MGVGTGEKAGLVATSLDTNAPLARPKAVLIDVNRQMLLTAVRRLKPDQIRPCRLDMLALRGDFEQLPHLSRHPGLQRSFVRSPGRRAVYLLLGNTFGNIDERAMLRSLRAVARRGDLVIFSQEFLETDAGRNPDEAILARYQSADMRALFAAPFAYLDAKQIPLHIRITRGYPRYSVLRRTRTVVACKVIGGRRIESIHSNRYDEEEFGKLLRRSGFEPIMRVPSPQNPFYKYVVARRG